MKRIIISSLAILIIFCWNGAALSAPVFNYDTGSITYADTFPDGTSFGMYTNSGEWLFTHPGNNAGSFLDDVEEYMRAYLHDDDFVLSPASNVAFSEYDNHTGTWEVISPYDAIRFYAVKAGNAYAVYKLISAENTGSWSTYDIWMSGLRGTGGKGGLEISHFTGYNGTTTAPVPEPATLLLLGAGIAAGFVGLKRRRNIGSIQ